MGGNRKLGSTISNGLDIEPYEYDNRVEIKGLLVRYQIDRNIIFRTKAGGGHWKSFYNVSNKFTDILEKKQYNVQLNKLKGVTSKFKLVL